MARSGILYSHVIKAAALVLADGRNPTVDNVRAALGGTGSKSTIAPLLKRWKEEHQETPPETEHGLPAALVEALTSLYQKMQQDVARQLETAREEQRVTLLAASEQVKKAETELKQLTGVKAALSAELGATQAALEQLKEEHHHRAVTLATLHSDNVGLHQRLADRADEIGALNRQLAQVRVQFEHYQEAAATQRIEERQAAEQRQDRLEQDNNVLQQRLAGQQAALAQQSVQIGQLQEEQARLLAAAALVHDELAALRPERDRLAFQLRQALDNGQVLAGKLDTAQEALTVSRMACAAQEKQLEMLAASLAAASRREQQLLQEQSGLIRHNAALLVQVGQAPPPEAT
ncbi:DNA-binding protein [Janthinobacterium agaricidamnosum]|uniref:KfrA N-terminal DNA-binding domain-containing protein n=1 Tax=Janthinobacterium agaricidamnosum NBRC 102515 = DSM 9628 TaxID=1349767 RepID=W0V5Q9_9BURK|nr:DNA-binding protein [Janthinobacterium agaricidamnosum]CDG83221.1 putative uncharacterized protein [Janthinobacterium agaricidamnosum NBRC 102515 = DSM 9628]